ncbi:MAG: hypothetical protein K2G84_03930 [Muribaculaceae bacterium]|nr:hypothetical protein [Muribaculaceae bacterium]
MDSSTAKVAERKKERRYASTPGKLLLVGDGDTDLDLYVYDRNGNLVCSDTDFSDDCVAVWNPRYTQTYTIRIKNRGRVANVYRMAVN